MASSPQHEPTMEEILASIRKIISEDSAEAQPAPTEEIIAAPVSAPAEADVLELTQEFHEVQPEPIPAPMPEPTPAPMPEPIQAAYQPPDDDVVFEPIEEPAVMTEAPSNLHEGIFSDKTRQALDHTFANIEPEQPAKPRQADAPALAVDGRTVEAVFERSVREAFEPVVNDWLGANADAIVERMKPLIREWMDEHLPALLEGAVRDEVARVAKARGTKR